MAKFIKVMIVILLIGGCVEKGKKKLTNAIFLRADCCFVEALESYKDAIKENPELIAAHAGLISCCFQLEKGDSIIKAYMKLFKENPDNPVYLYSYAFALRVNGELDSALNLYEKALDKGLKEGKIYSNIAYIYELREDSVNAKEFYKKAADKKYGSAFFSLADYEKDEEKAVALMKSKISYR